MFLVSIQRGSLVHTMYKLRLSQEGRTVVIRNENYSKRSKIWKMNMMGRELVSKSIIWQVSCN